MSDNFHLQLYRGTTAQNNAYTGPAGELTVDTTLSKLRLHDGSTAGGVEIGGMPTGSIIPYAGSTAPAGYLLCDGSAISRSTYSALFAIIGTTYGPGDGNTTFNIPSANDFPCGMPSNEFTNLTLEASSSTYTAPANGFVAIRQYFASENLQNFIGIYSASTSIDIMQSRPNKSDTATFMPIRKGEQFRVWYYNLTTSSESYFRFVYDIGTPSIIKY